MSPAATIVDTPRMAQSSEPSDRLITSLIAFTLAATLLTITPGLDGWDVVVF